MCGIVGYVGTGDARSRLIEGLRNLEYRGYDSAGIALVGEELSVFKRSGRVDDLAGHLPADAGGTCGIAHTRWSTHGRPTDANAHPHTDCTGRVAVVHNGIIENFDELRAELESRGHRFTSETDTEVVPHLVEEHLDDGTSLEAAVESALDRVRGTYAIAVTVAGQEGVVAARRDSPLVVGYGDDGTYLASDVTAFLEHTRDVTYLEDGDVATIRADGVTIHSDGEVVERPRQTVEWEADAAEKGGYDHYMLKEIHEQPEALRQALTGRVDESTGTVDMDVSLPDEYLRSLEEVQIVACGTSYHAGLYASRLFERLVDVRTTVEVASEYEFEGGRDPWRTLVVGVTQSGETADTLSAVRRANRAGARTLAVTNTVGSTVTRETDDTTYIRAGPEIGVAATKTFASQVATLALLAVQFGRVRSTVPGDVAADVVDAVRRLPGTVQQALDEAPAVAETAEAFADSRAFFFIGRRLGMPVALEGALKLKEISYDHAEGFPAGELKHGPLALVGEDTPVLAVLTEGARAEATLNNVKEVESRGAPVLGFASGAHGERFLDEAFEVPDLGLMEPLVANVYLQLFAYYVARHKGRPIDKPRNLAKSVTVE